MKIFTFELGKIYPENRRKYACGPTPPLLTQFNLEGIAWQGRGAPTGCGGATGGRESGKQQKNQQKTAVGRLAGAGKQRARAAFSDQTPQPGAPGVALGSPGVSVENA